MAVVVESGPAPRELPNLESSRSGTSWGAVLAGGLAAVGASLIFLLLGSGLGLASVSPWAGASVTATGLAVGAAIWLVVVQWLASAFGGYVAGRLRTKWADRFSDEVFFRDTAHGFLAWSVGTLLMVGIFASAGTTVLTGVGAAVSGGAAAAASQADTGSGGGYYIDRLFRTPLGSEPAAAETTPAPATTTTTDATSTTATATPATTTQTAAAPATMSQPAATEDRGAREESLLLFGRAVGGQGNADDEAYLAQLVSERTGLAPADAEQRVQEAIADAKAAADSARKAAATASFLTALSLLIGAFVAAAAGGLGGRHRDELSEAR